jgi:hypothetical protein
MPDEEMPGLREYYVRREALTKLTGKVIALRKPPQFQFGHAFVLELKRHVDVGAQTIRGIDVFEEVNCTRYNLNTPGGILYWQAEIARRRENSQLLDLIDASHWARDAATPKSYFDWRSTAFTRAEVPAISERAAKLTQLVTGYLDEYGL